MKLSTYSVPDISCEGCVNSISQALRPLRGVLDVTGDPESKTIWVRHEEPLAPAEAIRKAIEDAGFEPVLKSTE